VTFAREQQLAGKSAFEAAIEAGHTRIRPVLMTAAAMIVGMIPMAIGAAARSRTPRWRGGDRRLLFATPTTLLVVPYLFAMLRKRNDGKDITAYSKRCWNEFQSTRTHGARGNRSRTRPCAEPHLKPRVKSRWRGALSGAMLALMIAAAIAYGGYSHYAQSREVAAIAKEAGSWCRR